MKFVYQLFFYVSGNAHFLLYTSVIYYDFYHYQALFE